MILKYLQLINFRNFEHLKIEFDSGINIISGRNGQGKTSILESIYYLALTKSFRTSNDNNVISYDKNHFDITSSVITLLYNQEKQFRLYYALKEGKHLFIEKKEVKKFSEYIGTLPCVILTLDDMRLTMGGPQERRKFLDILISQVSPVYLEDLKIYRKTVQQRNALLASDNREMINQQLPSWNKQLIKYGSNIILQRTSFMEFLNQHIGEFYARISGEDEPIHAEYFSTVSEDVQGMEKTEIAGKFEKKLSLLNRYEIEKKMTVIGPHRDDMYFYKNMRFFKDFCSQGENKTMVIALKFLEWEYISREKKIKPVLLLDDIFGELDKSRMNGLIDFLQRIGQAFITTTMQEKFRDHVPGRLYLLQNKELFNA